MQNVQKELVVSHIKIFFFPEKDTKAILKLFCLSSYGYLIMDEKGAVLCINLRGCKLLIDA